MTPLDEAPVWSRQAEAYQRLGPRAFSEGIVPWRATTCPLIADVEAELIAAFAQDVAPRDVPLTVIDVGAGTGRLGFHLAAALARRDVAAHLVLADLAPSNLDALAMQPQLAELHRDGRLSFQRLDAMAPPRFDGPCVFLAHYLFDTLPHAAWRLREGALRQGFVDDAWRWDFRPCTATHPELAGRPDGTYLVPVGAARALKAWAAAVSGPLLVLAADKGVEPRSATQDPQLALHDSISAGVDFQALSELVREEFAWLQPRAASSVFALHAFVREDLPSTRAAWLSRAARNEVRSLLERFERLLQGDPGPDALLDFIDQALADPDLLAQLTGRLREATLTAPQAGRLVSLLAAAAQQHFIFKQVVDIPFELALTAHHLGALDLAVALYLLSLRESGVHPTPLINLALAQHALGQPALARQALEVVLATTPDHVRARALLTEWRGE